MIERILHIQSETNSCLKDGAVNRTFYDKRDYTFFKVYNFRILDIDTKGEQKTKVLYDSKEDKNTPVVKYTVFCKYRGYKPMYKKEFKEIILKNIKDYNVKNIVMDSEVRIGTKEIEKLIGKKISIK